MLLFQFLMFSDDSRQFFQAQRIISCHGIWNVVLHNRYFLLNIFQFTLFLIQFGLLNCFLPALVLFNLGENILIFLQTGEGREGCIGFRKGLNMNQQYMLKAAIGAALGCAALALGVALKRRVRI